MKEYGYSRIRYIGSFLLGVATDLVFFYFLFSIGVAWNTAHVFSFLAEAVAIYTLWVFWPPEDVPVEGFRRRMGGYVIVQLFALFLRGGILAALVEPVNVSPMTAIIPAAVASSIVTLLGTHLWLLQRREGRSEQGEWGRGLTIAIMIYAVSLRVLYGGTFEFLDSEAYYWNYAQHLDLGYLDHPPMVGWLIWIFTTLLGHEEFVVRLGAMGCWLVTAYYAYKLTYATCGAAAAFRAFFLVTVLPIFFGVGLVMTPDAPLVACWAGALYYLYRSVIEGRQWSWLGAGIFMGLGMLSKYTIALLGLAVLAFMLMDREARKWFARPEPYLALALAFALFSPVIIWNAQHQWASFYFQGPRRLFGNFDFTLPELIGSVTLLLTVTGFVAVVAAVVSKKSILPNPITIKTDRTHRFLLTSTILPFSVFLLFSLFRLTKLSWTGPIWLGTLPYIAASMVPERSSMVPGRSSLAERLPRYVASAWPATIVIMLLLYGALFHYTVLGFPGIPYPKGLLGSQIPIGLGIPDLARQVETLESDFERQNGEKPLTVCMDSKRLASWIAFYRAKMAGSGNESRVTEIIRNTTGGHLFLRDSHMYRYWHPIEEYKDRPLLIIGVRRHHLLKDEVTSRINPMSDIERGALQKNGKPAAFFFYQFAKMR